MARGHFPGYHCVIIVFSVDSPASFKSIDTHMNNIDNYCSKDVIKIIAGNKCDLDERHITWDDMIEKAQDLGVKSFETSAMENKRSTINDLFAEISMMLVSGQQPRGAGGSFKLDKR